MANPFSKKFKAKRIFSDRDESKKIIREAVLNPQSYEEYRIKVFYGVGGQGKSYLKNKYLMNDFLKEYSNYQGLVIFDGLDFEKNEQKRLPVEGLLSIAKFLIEKGGIALPAFTVGFSRYFQLTANNSDISLGYPFLFQIPKTVQYNTNKNFHVVYEVITSIKSSLVEDIPVVGHLLNKISKKGKNKFIEWMSKSDAKEVLSDIDELDAFELTERLPQLLGYDLYCEFKGNAKTNKIPKKRIVIVLDGYETLWQNEKGRNINRDKWVRSLVNYCPGVLFLFFGRDKLLWKEVDRNEELVSSIEQFPLDGLDESYAINYLQSVPIENTEIINLIIRNSKGNEKYSNEKCSPLYLDTEVETYEYIINSGKKPTLEDFKSFNKSVEIEIVDRLLNHLPDQLRVGIKPLSLPNYINYDILSVIESVGFPVGTISLEVLAEMSVFEWNDNKLHMQPFVKKILAKKYRDEFPNKFLSVNYELFNYFNNKLNDSKNKPVDAVIEENIRNAAKHLKNVSHKKFISWVQNINDLFQRDSFYDIFKDLLDECIEMNEIADGTILSDENIALLHYQLSIKQYNSGYIIEAEKSIAKAIEIFRAIPNIQNTGSMVEAINLSDPIHMKVQSELQQNEVMQRFFELSKELMAIFCGEFDSDKINPIDRFEEIKSEMQDILNNNPNVTNLVVQQAKTMFEGLNFIPGQGSNSFEFDSNGALKLTEEVINENKKNVGIFENFLTALEHQASVFLQLNEIAKCKIIYDELENYVTNVGYSLDKTTYARFLVACGRLSEAEPLLFEEYLNAKTSNLEIPTAHFAQRLALLFLSQNRFEEAVAFCNKAITISKKVGDGKSELVYKHSLAKILIKEGSSSPEALSLLNEVEEGYTIFFHSNPYFWGLLYGDLFSYWIGLDKNKSKTYYRHAINSIEKGKGTHSLESIGMTIDLLSKVPEANLGEYNEELNKIIELFTIDLERTTAKFGIYHHHLFNGLNIVSSYYFRNDKKKNAQRFLNLQKEYNRLLSVKTKIRTDIFPKLNYNNPEEIIEESLKITSLPTTHKLGINKYDIPFYSDSVLFEFKFVDNEHAQDKYIIKRNNELMIIDWDIKTIYSFNRSYLQISDDNVLSYLKFFTDVLKSGAGTFYILEPDNIPWRQDLDIDVKLKEIIEEIIDTPKLLKKFSDKYLISAHVLYLNEMFYCEFLVHFGEKIEKGYVEMKNDELITIVRNDKGEFVYTQGEEAKDNSDNNNIELPCRVDLILS